MIFESLIPAHPVIDEAYPGVPEVWRLQRSSQKVEKGAWPCAESTDSHLQGLGMSPGSFVPSFIDSCIEYLLNHVPAVCRVLATWIVSLITS